MERWVVKSHLKIIHHAKQNNYKQILILEDDFLLTNNFVDKLSTIYNKIRSQNIHIDMLYLGFSIIRKNAYENTTIENLKKVISGHATHAYILNQSFYNTVISEISNCYCEIDVCYNKLQKK